MSKKLLCAFIGRWIEIDGIKVLLIKGALPKPFVKSKDGMGMLTAVDAFRQQNVEVVQVFEAPSGVLVADWPDSIPAKLQPKTILASDLSPMLWFEDGTVEEGFGNS